jgi:hypothetical protein
MSGMSLHGSTPTNTAAAEEEFGADLMAYWGPRGARVPLCVTDWGPSSGDKLCLIHRHSILRCACLDLLARDCKAPAETEVSLHNT